MARAPLASVSRHERKKRRYHAILCLLSGVIANVPVGKCAIVCAIRRAKSKLTLGELLLLAFIKVPCAIDYVQCHVSPSQDRMAWVRVLSDAIDHFGARCCMKDKNLSGMDPTYRRHRASVAGSLETTTGLPYMHGHLLHGLTDAEFTAIQQWSPNWGAQSIESIARSLQKVPFRLGGTRYKRTHSARSLSAAVGAIRGTRMDPNGSKFLKMSSSLDAIRAWLYPKRHRSTPKRAIKWVKAECERVLSDVLPEGVIYDHHTSLLRGIASMNRGDECCFVCEVGKIAPQLRPVDVAAMEDAIRSNIGILTWRCIALEDDSADAGVFASARESVCALVDQFSF